MDKKISVVCTVYNDQKEIEDLLKDVDEQKMQPNEIVIADGGSKDNTIKIINSYKEKTKININLLEGKRLNISQGLNEAIKNSKYDIIIIMSTGNKYDKNFINELCKKYEETEANIVFAPIRGNNNFKFSKLYNKAFLNGEYGSRIPSNHGVLIEKSVFTKNGLFYEKFIYAGEDAEFFDRARENEIKIECAENAKLEWDVPNNLRSFKKQIRAYTIAKMQIESFDLLKKYKKKYAIIILLILLLILIILQHYIFVFITITILFFNYIYKCWKKSIKEYILINYRQWLEIKVILSNLSKLSKKYKVNKKAIQKL